MLLLSTSNVEGKKPTWMSNYAEFYADAGLRNCAGKIVKSKSLVRQVQKLLEICMLVVAGVPRDVGLSTHGLRAGS